MSRPSPVFTARHETTCPDCGEAVQVGDLAQMLGARAYHVGCAGRAAMRASAPSELELTARPRGLYPAEICRCGRPVAAADATTCADCELV